MMNRTYDLMKDMNLQILMVTLIATAVLVYWFVRRLDSNWWPYLSGKTPTWGGNESIVLLMFSLLFLGATLSTYMCLRKHSTQENMTLTYLIYFMVVILGLLSLYFLSDKQRKYSEAFTLVALTMISLVILTYRSYVLAGRDYVILVPALLALGVSTYLVFWVYYVKKH
jgi:tryptophan-rich sensory protein